MTISDLIQLLGIIASFSLSAIAIWQSQKSIKLTEKSITEANRPQISIYLDYIYTVHSIHEYLVIKNFGNTGATITELSIDKKIPSLNNKDNLFTQGTPFYLAPNQSYSTCIRLNAFDHKEEIYKISVLYSDNVQKEPYSESFVLDQSAVVNLQLPKSNPVKSETTSSSIAKVSEEILRKML